MNATYGGIYEPGIAFPLAACLMLFGSLISLLMVIGKRISGEGNSSVIEQNQTYPFSSVVFASWDFHIKEAEAVRNLKNALRSQIREMLHDAEWSQKTMTFREQLLTGTSRPRGFRWPMARFRNEETHWNAPTVATHCLLYRCCNVLYHRQRRCDQRLLQLLFCPVDHDYIHLPRRTGFGKIDG